MLSRKSCGNFFIFVNIVNGYEHRAERPANGISDCHGEKHIREHSAYRKEIYLTENYEREQLYVHCYPRIARTAE